MVNKIILKDNRKIFIICISIIITVLTMMNVLYLITTIFDNNAQTTTEYFELILFGSFEIVSIVVLLLILFYKRKRIVLTANKIEIYKSQRLVLTIFTKDVNKIYYDGFEFMRYINGLYKNGICQIFIETNKNNCSFGLVSKKDAMKIMNYYPELV
ncbi:MAG: hypothetical protein PHF05_04005 [Candidatus Izemoplasmatales bacterium]|nr:hypothetical protein [Candidatus Izemoplasmatales bacterium]MDY0138679.1 hypothetical protein [Candidatus Izemoplasmatales bacterium]